MTQVRIEGEREVARNLRALGADLAAPDGAFNAIAAHGASKAAAAAPRLTGTTAGSIRPAATSSAAVIEAPFPAGPINYKTNRFMDAAAADLHIKAFDIFETAITRSIERNHLT